MSRVNFQGVANDPTKNTTTIDFRLLNDLRFGSKFLARLLQGIQALPKCGGGILWRRKKPGKQRVQQDIIAIAWVAPPSDQ